MIVCTNKSYLYNLGSKFWDIEQKVGECEWCQGHKMGTKILKIELIYYFQNVEL